MKSFWAFVSAFVCIGFVASHMHIPHSCYHCSANKLEDCDSSQMMMNCSNNTFPNVGSGNCYTAVGWYMLNNNWRSGALRGCVNCSDLNAAKETIKREFDALPPGWKLDLAHSNVMCCNSTGCNTMTVTLPSAPTVPPTPESSTEPKTTATGSTIATTIFSSIGGIFAILLPVSGWPLN